MTRWRTAQLSGILLASAGPALASAQARPPVARSGPIGVVLPAPPPRSDGHLQSHFRRDADALILRRFGSAFSYPIVMASPYAPAPVQVPVLVPYYYPVRVPLSSGRAEPKVPPRPYDPTKARMTIIGSGADGGGGVMRVDRIGNDTLAITWLGTARPMRTAELFLADSLQRPLVRRAIDAERREARFSVASLRQAAYSGLTVVFGDRSTRTTLVPLPQGAVR